jgi:chromosome partitioning protein
LTVVISLFNQAGGVGKSTLTQNLGYHLSLRHHKILLVDIDPQASLTTFMGLEPADLEKTIYDALVSEQDEPLPLHRDLHGMDLAPANILLANAEQELIFAELREFRLKEVLGPLLDNYDFILIDCPPS